MLPSLKKHSRNATHTPRNSPVAIPCILATPCGIKKNVVLPASLLNLNAVRWSSSFNSHAAVFLLQMYTDLGAVWGLSLFLTAKYLFRHIFCICTEQSASGVIHGLFWNIFFISHRHWLTSKTLVSKYPQWQQTETTDSLISSPSFYCDIEIQFSLDTWLLRLTSKATDIMTWPFWSYY